MYIRYLKNVWLDFVMLRIWHLFILLLIFFDAISEWFLYFVPIEVEHSKFKSKTNRGLHDFVIKFKTSIIV